MQIRKLFYFSLSVALSVVLGNDEERIRSAQVDGLLQELTTICAFVENPVHSPNYERKYREFHDQTVKIKNALNRIRDNLKRKISSSSGSSSRSTEILENKFNDLNSKYSKIKNLLSKLYDFLYLTFMNLGEYQDYFIQYHNAKPAKIVWELARRKHAYSSWRYQCYTSAEMYYRKTCTKVEITKAISPGPKLIQFNTGDLFIDVLYCELTCLGNTSTEKIFNTREYIFIAPTDIHMYVLRAVDKSVISLESGTTSNNRHDKNIISKQQRPKSQSVNELKQPAKIERISQKSRLIGESSISRVKSLRKSRFRSSSRTVEIMTLQSGESKARDSPMKTRIVTIVGRVQNI